MSNRPARDLSFINHGRDEWLVFPNTETGQTWLKQQEPLPGRRYDSAVIVNHHDALALAIRAAQCGLDVA